MKATGIVRRIDELGRVVIPKEIRKNLRIREGENLEIYVDSSENIVLKKFSVMKQLVDFAQYLTDAIASYLKHDIIITDTDTIIAMSGTMKKECLNQPISTFLETIIEKKENVLENYSQKLQLTDHFEIESNYVIHSILVHGDVVGLMIISSYDKIAEFEKRITDIVSTFFSKYLEE